MGGMGGKGGKEVWGEEGYKENRGLGICGFYL